MTQRTEAVVRGATTDQIAWFEDLSRTDVPRVGGKGANLGELSRAELPVPPGFVVTADAYLQAMEAGGVRAALQEVVANLDVDSPEALAQAADELRDLVRSAGMPEALRRAVLEAYAPLGEEPRVAVRSSATAEDTASTSFAGMNETFTNVQGGDELVRRVVDCWASLWSPRVVAYRATHGLADEPAIAVVVQLMVDSDASGVMFTADPATGDRDSIVIEAAYGLGEVVVGGQVEPDTYVLSKDGPHIKRVHLGTKAEKIVRGPDGHDERLAVPPEEQKRRVLDDEALLELAHMAAEIERHYGAPQDVEFAREGTRTWIVQSRPITTLGETPTPAERGARHRPRQRPGRGARCRVRAGPHPRSTADAPRLLKGEVLVAPMTSPDWVPTMRRAAALVTDGGGMTCHAAIVGRELRLPTVVATRTATTVLRDGELVTVDGAKGVVRAGAAPAAPATAGPTVVPASAPAAAPPPVAEPTGTLLYVNLAIAEHAEEVAALPVDGVGLLRAEFMITDALGGEHPKQLLADGPREEFVDKMAASLLRITRAFAPRPVVYRTIDFRTNEFRGLAGGEEFEPVEENPMIGYRGCYRYIREPELFALELDVLARVRERDAEPAPDDPVRAHEVGARGVPRARRRAPARPAARAAALGDGRGAVGRLPHPRVRRARHRRRVDRVERPHPARCSASTATPRSAPSCSTSRTRRCSTPSAGSSAPRATPASPRRCAVRRRRTGRSSPSTSCATASRRSR